MGDHGPLPRCPEHKIVRPTRDPCARHTTAVTKLLSAFDRFGVARDTTLCRKLERLATIVPYVVVAAYAGIASETRREALKEKRRGAPPRGWRLGRELLRQWGLPEDYLPATRRVWMPREGKSRTRVDALHRILRTAWDAEHRARDRYNRAMDPARREYAAALLAVRPAERRFGEASERLEQAKEQNVALAKEAGRATETYRDLLRYAKADTADGAVLSIPRAALASEALSTFWTKLARELKTLYEPFVTTVLESRRASRRWCESPDPQNQGYNDLTVARLTLATLAPTYHLDTTFGRLRDRSRAPRR